MESKYLLKVEGISKSFGRTKALDNISLTIGYGEIRGLVGENGAGKSVFVRILAGDLVPDKGKIFFEGKEVRFRSPHDAQKMGIFLVYQDPPLIPDMSVAMNIFLGKEPKSCKYVLNQREIERKAEELIYSTFGVKIDPRAKIEELDAIDRKIVAIARAIETEAKLIIFDETTDELTEKEKDKFSSLLKSLKNRGITVIYISHVIEDALKNCDNITIFRDGKLITTISVKSATFSTVADLMTGESKEFVFPQKSVPKDEIVLSLKNVESGSVMGIRLKNITFSLRKGELLGIFGGRLYTKILLRGLYGDIPLKGEIRYLGKKISASSISDSLRNKIVYISGNRFEHIFYSRPILSLIHI